MLVLNMPVLQTPGKKRATSAICKFYAWLQVPLSAQTAYRLLYHEETKVHPRTAVSTPPALGLALTPNFSLPHQKAAKPFFPPVPAGMTRSTLKRTVLDSGLRSCSNHL